MTIVVMFGPLAVGLVKYGPHSRATAGPSSSGRLLFGETARGTSPPLTPGVDMAVPGNLSSHALSSPLDRAWWRPS